MHPVTGLLRKTRPKRETAVPPVEVQVLRIGTNERYEKISGLWFYIRYGRDDNGAPIVVAKRSCDRKTIRAIEEKLAAATVR